MIGGNWKTNSLEPNCLGKNLRGFQVNYTLLDISNVFL
jgi:hypothetical protein